MSFIVHNNMCNSTNMVRHYHNYHNNMCQNPWTREWPGEVLKLPLKYKWDSAKNGASKMHRYAQSTSGPQNQV